MKETRFADYVGAFGSALDYNTHTAGVDANGNAIPEPWKRGRTLALTMHVGDIGGSVTGGVLKLQGQQRSDDAWVDLVDKDGATLVVDSAILANNGAADSGASTKDAETGGGFIASVPMSRVDGDTYKAVRVVFNPTGANVAAAIVYHVIDPVIYPAEDGPTDRLFSKLVRTSPA